MEPRDPLFSSKVRQSFDRQPVMRFIGATITRLEPGLVEIGLDHRDELTQQHGYFHAGVVGTIADSAGGYAAFSLMPAGSSVLTVEYKLNLIAPADGERLRATGTVIKAGRTLSVCDLRVVVSRRGVETLCAVGMQTVFCLADHTDGPRETAPPTTVAS
jgi:uncharacterized protein (TIGR00369 family)